MSREKRIALLETWRNEMTNNLHRIVEDNIYFLSIYYFSYILYIYIYPTYIKQYINI